MTTNPKKLYWQKLIAGWKLTKRQNRAPLPSKRAMKSRGLARGQILRSSRVTNDVPIERYFGHSLKQGE